jgi:putative MATE family efflux protein
MGRLIAKKNIDMLNGPILRSVIAFGIPLAIMAILQQLYNAADVIVVGQFAGDEALGAVGATGSSTNLLINLFLGLSVGASVVVSQSFGEGNMQKVSRAVHSAIGIALIGGVFLLVLGQFIAYPMMKLLDTPENIIDGAALYMRIIFLGMPASILYNFICGIFRAIGNTRLPMVISMIAGIINVILNLVFVICFGMDVDGVGFATIISQYFSATVALIYLMRDHGPIRFSLKNLKIHGFEAKRILGIGIPSGINGSLFSISNMMIQSSVNSFGSYAVAGAAAAASIENVQYAAQNAFSQASLSFIGQNYGAKNFSRFKKIIGACCLTTTSISFLFALVLIPFGKAFLGIYSNDPEVITFGYIKIIVLSASYFLCGINEVYTGVIRGMGRSTTAMIISIFGICFLRAAWIYSIFLLIKTPTVLYLSYTASYIVAIIGNIIAYKIILKKEKEKQKELSQ